jgi:predicted permease
MYSLRVLLARVRALSRRNAIADEIREEMRFHLERRAQDYEREGLTPEQARRAASRQFGSLALQIERGYDVRGAGLIETLWQDVRDGARALRHSWTFSGVALTVIALAIGAGTAIFSLVDAVFLRALPYDEHDRIAAVSEVDPESPDEPLGHGYATTQNYLDWRRTQQVFDGLALTTPAAFQVKNEQGGPILTKALRVTWEFFPILRVAPVAGRWFTQDDEKAPGAIVILSHGFWQRWFGGASDVIGKPLQLGAQTFQIVGVMPRGFSYPPGQDKPTELYVPQVFREQDAIRGPGWSRNSNLIARLKSGIAFRAADVQINGVFQQIHQQFPGWMPHWRASVVPLHEELVGRTRTWMLLLLTSVGLVLLIGCANVANLMLARATQRTREMSVRTALGASRARIVRALLTESLLLSVVGDVIGLGLAYGGVGVLRAWLPAEVPRVSTIGIDDRVMAVSLAVTLVTGLLCGLAPALSASRLNLARTMKEGDRSTSAGRGTRRLRSVFVASQVAFAVVLLTGAGLFIGSFIDLMRVDPGFDFHHTLVFRVNVRRNTAAQESLEAWTARNATYFRDIQRALASVPSVKSVAALDDSGMPLTDSWSRLAITLPGGSQLTGTENAIDVRGVSPNFFSQFGIPVLQGRGFTNEDRPDGVPVVIVNQSAARKYWPERNPIGEHVTIGTTDRLIVGVVADIRQYGLEKPARQAAFLPFGQQFAAGANLLVKTYGDPLAAFPAIKATIRGINAAQTFPSDVDSLDAYMERLIAQRRFNMTLLTILGVLGLVIATVGIFGVMAYLVTLRTAEIGLRMALGASPHSILSMVLRNAAALVGAGLVLGLIAAWPLSRLAESLLFQIRAHDPRVFMAALLLLVVTGLAAAIVPARRAARVDPVIALRTE